MMIDKVQQWKGRNSTGNGTGQLVDLQQVVKTFTGAAGVFTALKGLDLKVGGRRVCIHCRQVGQRQIHPD